MLLSVQSSTLRPRFKPYPPRLVCSGLGCTLKRLHLTTDVLEDPLATTIRHHVQPAALTLRADDPTADMWLPQLQECNVMVRFSAQMSQLNSRLQAASLTQLSSLVLQDVRPAAARLASHPSLPALPRLPALRELVSGSREGLMILLQQGDCQTLQTFSCSFHRSSAAVCLSRCGAAAT